MPNGRVHYTGRSNGKSVMPKGIVHYIGRSGRQECDAQGSSPLHWEVRAAGM